MVCGEPVEHLTLKYTERVLSCQGCFSLSEMHIGHDAFMETHLNHVHNLSEGLQLHTADRSSCILYVSYIWCASDIPPLQLQQQTLL